MSFHHTRDGPRSLPNVEVFYFDGEREPGDCFEGCEPGWYWWACFPGCLPDSDPCGPWPSKEAAMEDAEALMEGEADSDEDD